MPIILTLCYLTQDDIVSFHPFACKIHITPDTLNLIEENMGNSLENIGTGSNFLNRTPMAQALRATIDKWDLMELKSFCKAKNTVSMG